VFTGDQPGFASVRVAHNRPHLSAESFIIKPIWQWGPRRWLQELSQWPNSDSGWAHRVFVQLSQSVALKPKIIVVSTPSESVLDAALLLADIWGSQIVCDIGASWRRSRLRPERNAIFRKPFEKAWLANRLKRLHLITVPDEIIQDEIRQEFGMESEIWPLTHLSSPDQAALDLSPQNHIHIGLISSGLKSPSEGDFLTQLARFERACCDRNDLVLHIGGLLSHAERQILIQSPKAAQMVHYGPLDAIMANRLKGSVDYQISELDVVGIGDLKKPVKSQNEVVVDQGLPRGLRALLT